MVDGEPLEPAVNYRAAGHLQDIDVTFTAPSMPLYGFAARGFVGIGTDEDGVQLALAVLPNAGLRVFLSPDVSPRDVNLGTFGAITADAPADVVAWLAERPFLDAGPIEDGLRVGGLEGRGFSYQVGDLSESARACGSDPAPRCAATLWASGVMFHMAAGDRGRILAVVVEGQEIIVMVREDPATDPLVATLRLVSPPVPEQADGATRLPYFAPAVTPGQHYYIDKVASDVGLVVTAPTEPVTASQRDDLAWFGDPDQRPAARHYYLTAVDATALVANEHPSLDPYALLGPGGILPDDLYRFLSHTAPLPSDPVGWLAEQPYVAVESAPHNARIAGHRARVVDVRASRVAEGIACPDREGFCVMPFARGMDAFPVVISTEYVTRVIDLTVGDERILIAADRGTPGFTLLRSLQAFRLSGLAVVKQAEAADA
jgi:hypothetical protein